MSNVACDWSTQRNNVAQAALLVVNTSVLMCQVKKYIQMGIHVPYSNVSFGEVYRRIYVRKFFDRISDNTPPQMKSLNTVIP